MVRMPRIPQRVVFGKGAIEQIPELVKGRYSKAVVFSDRGVEQSGVLELPLQQLRAAGLALELMTELPTEPTCEEAQQVVDRFVGTGADLIVAVGGGSVMDVAKLASVVGDRTVRELVDNPALCRKTVPLMAIPTTAGTGAEATPNSIVLLPEKNLKVGIVNPDMIADMVILDGEMTRLLPAPIAASTGVDALCHAVECYTSLKATPASNLYALEAAQLLLQNLEAACTGDAEAREKVLLGSFYAGVAIAGSGTTAVHALSYPLGGRFRIPHGVANAMLLMPILRFNQESCREQLAAIENAMDNTPYSAEEKADRLVKRIGALVERLGIPTKAGGYGVMQEHLPLLVEAGMDVKRLLQNNRRSLTAADAEIIYRQIL